MSIIRERSSFRARSLGALLTLLLAIVLVLLLWNERQSILRSAAHSWAVSDQATTPADAVAVLAGGDDRPRMAVQLYRSGLVSRILLDDDDDRRLVHNLNIPPQAVEMFGKGLNNTYEEACALAAWAEKNGAQHIIVPTELFPSRRVKWIFAREFNSVPDKVIVDVLPIPKYTADNWWRSTEGRDEFATEIVKYSYYRLRYSFDPC
jgi:uncharacterized SAM-binding protein YcdF (DUF218 family)